MNNILIVDDDQYFISWLGGALVAAKQNPWPACSVSDAIVLVSDPVQPPDLLIINLALARSSELIGRLRSSCEKLKVIAFGKRGKDKSPNIHEWCRRPRHLDESVKEEWLDAVQRLLIQRDQAGTAVSRTSAGKRVCDG